MLSRMCNTHFHPQVRAEAARLLGSMHLVSDSFLFQTLDKKLMSDLKVTLETCDKFSPS